jgi:hypothetical protein
MKHMPSALALASALCHIATIAVLMRGRTDLATAPGLAGGSHHNLESAEPPQDLADLPAMDPLLAQTVARLEEAVAAVEKDNAEVKAILNEHMEGHGGTGHGSWGARRSPPTRQARQDGLDAQGDGAHRHRSGRVTHGQKVQKEIRLPCPGRCPGDVVQHLLHQHLVVRRRDLGDLEKSPITTSVDPSASAT